MSWEGGGWDVDGGGWKGTNTTVKIFKLVLPRDPYKQVEYVVSCARTGWYRAAWGPVVAGMAACQLPRCTGRWAASAHALGTAHRATWSPSTVATLRSLWEGAKSKGTLVLFRSTVVSKYAHCVMMMCLCTQKSCSGLSCGLTLDVVWGKYGVLMFLFFICIKVYEIRWNAICLSGNIVNFWGWNERSELPMATPIGESLTQLSICHQIEKGER